MSGRAGRRGKDERGICIIMIDEQVSVEASVFGFLLLQFMNIRSYYFPQLILSFHPPCELPILYLALWVWDLLMQ